MATKARHSGIFNYVDGRAPNMMTVTVSLLEATDWYNDMLSDRHGKCNREGKLFIAVGAHKLFSVAPRPKLIT